MRFIVDAQLPPALARLIAGLGVEAVHVVDIGLLAAKDGEIWAYALEQAGIVVTKDEDFAIRASVSHPHPPIVWLRLGNCSKAELLRWFEDRWPEILRCLNEGAGLVEIV